ncbi:transcriptional regulator [Pedobacter rhodius]|uniref:Transcriptional regulator n=1 Tax=Pedobacter rhodius TaxID=3004098 RepID=A0ABT4L232_9SPHI|nr:transcriptional regulator [Pedobacter sp. SJ11]MCZ4225251.1 transcriptional regulator [Pedobacter sp. SJ11]
MEIFHLNEDIKVMYVTAASFPEGIETAHRKLHDVVAFDEKRRYFGLSKPNGKSIVYKAAAEELNPGEAQILGFESFTIQKGDFISEYISDFMSDISLIGKTFEKLLSDSHIDPNGYCLEMYIDNKDVRCMVPLKSFE